MHKSLEANEYLVKANLRSDSPLHTFYRRVFVCVTYFSWTLGLHTILPFPIVYGMYCNKGRSWGNTILRTGVGGEGSEVPKQGGCLRIMVLILVQG